MTECSNCQGSGRVRSSNLEWAYSSPAHDWETCPKCSGRGSLTTPLDPPARLKNDDDHGAGLIHQVASPLAETEPRPNTRERIADMLAQLHCLRCCECEYEPQGPQHRDDCAQYRAGTVQELSTDAASPSVADTAPKSDSHSADPPARRTLRDYVKHDENCEREMPYALLPEPRGPNAGDVCTCGLDALLADPPARIDDARAVTQARRDAIQELCSGACEFYVAGEDGYCQTCSVVERCHVEIGLIDALIEAVRRSARQHDEETDAEVRS